MPDAEKNTIVNVVRKRMEALLQDELVFTDEHYCFPRTFGGRRLNNGYYGEKLTYRIKKDICGRKYEVVFNYNCFKRYDLSIYIEIDPHVILDRFQSSVGVKYNPFATYDDIRSWQLFEIENVQRMCHHFGVPMYYIYDPAHSGEEVATIISDYLDKCHIMNKKKKQRQ